VGWFADLVSDEFPYISDRAFWDVLLEVRQAAVLFILIGLFGIEGLAVFCAWMEVY
jgi:hypothetical protein